MKVAFVHDWLVTYRGGEKVLEAIIKLYPEAVIFTMFYDPKAMPSSISSRKIIYPQKLNKLRRIRKALLPIYPIIIESFPLEEYDLVISTSSCVAKGVIVGPNSKHLCYIHSPMRYIWDQRSQYFHNLMKIPLVRAIIHASSSLLRLWDVSSSNRVDAFIANSNFVRERIRRYYGRSSEVIHPPVNIEKFRTYKGSKKSRSNYFLVAGAFVSYKRFDLAIEAAKIANKKLIVAGSGPEEKNLRSIAGDSVEFLISPNQEVWTDLMFHADAMIFPGVEDFGIVAIEALSSGTPLIAFRKGGALDFVEPGLTGEFFSELTPESLANSLMNFDSSRYSRYKLHSYVEKFSPDYFSQRIKSQIENLIGECAYEA